MTDVAIGIDIGTTAIKVALIPAHPGRDHVLAEANCSTPWRLVPSGREMRPSQLLDAVMTTVAEATGRLDVVDRVVGVGVASFGQSGTLVDSSGAALAPFVSWDDSRFETLGSRLADDIGREKFAATTGLAPSGCWSANHLVSLASLHGPGATWLGVADWIVLSLGGVRSSEFSLASESGLLDVVAGQWSDDVRDWASAHADVLPPLSRAGAFLGRGKVGTVVGAALTIAGHDHAVGSLGAGATGAGHLYDSAGTSETLVRRSVSEIAIPTDLVLNSGIQVGRHVMPGLRVTTSQRTSWALERVLSALRLDHAPPIGVGDVRPVPIAGVMTGDPRWPAGSAAAAVWAAGQSSVADSVALSAGLLDSVCGPHERTTISGGWSQNADFVAARADRLRQVSTASVAQPGAVGAALLGAVAAGFRPPFN